MRPKTRPGFYLIAVFTLLLLGSALFKHASFSVLAQGANPASLQPVVLTDAQQKYPLGLQMQILEDPGGELTIEDVASSAYDTKFTQSKTEVPIYGFSNSAYWVRFRLDNQTPSTNRWLLQLAFPNMHYVDLYLPTPDGKDWITKQSGTLRPVSNRDILNHQILFELPQQAQDERTYYLRFQNGASMTLPLFVWQPEAFFRTENTAQYFFGLYYGALLMILIYNLFVFLSLRETSHFYYICFLSSVILYSFSYDGFAALYMWPGLDSLNDLTSRFFFLATMASILMFTDSFLEIKKKHPKFHTLIMFMLAGWGILFLSIFWTNYHTTARLAAPFAVLSLGVAAITGLISLRDGFRPARFFLLSWLGFLIPSISVILVRVGLIPSTNINENLFRVGMLWLAAFWSLSLTDRVNLLKKETESANRLLRNSESKLSQILDGLPLGVVVYEKDRKPSFANKRTYEILSNSTGSIAPDLTSGRTLEMTVNYFSMKKTSTDQAYPIEEFPINNALGGTPAYADNIEADLGEKRVPLEVWASPVKDDEGNVDSVVVAMQDVTQRKQAEGELIRYRDHLEALVKERTIELNEANDQMQQRLAWLSAVIKVHHRITGVDKLAAGYQELSAEILHFLKARLVFVLRWDSQDEAFDVVSCSQDVAGTYNLQALKALFEKERLLRSEIEQGKLLICSRDEDPSVFEFLLQCFPAQEVASLILAPLAVGPSVIGVLGIAVSETAEEIMPEKSDLVARMALDLSTLAQEAMLLDQTLVLATMEERNRLARELHDSVTQELFSASLIAELLPHRLQRDPESAVRSAVELRRLTRGALAEMRTMLFELRPAAITKVPLAELLAQLTEGITARTDLVFHLYIDNVPPLPEEVQMAFYRIAQEALNNIVKHADARQVVVSLSATPPITSHHLEGWNGEIKLLVQDDGCGLPVTDQRRAGFGVGIMHERSAAIRASLDIESEPGHGTMVTLTWPMNGRRQDG